LILDFLAPSPRGTERELGGSSFNMDSIRKFLQQATLLGKAVQDSQKYGWRFRHEVKLVSDDVLFAVQEQLKSASLELMRELKSCGVFYLRARGEIVAPHTVEVNVNGRKRHLTAETLVVATGDRPQYLDIPGDREYCLTSEDLLSLPHPPARTLVVCGSAEGLECAGFLFSLGLQVTVMLLADLLQGFDLKMAEKIENYMFVGGVDFLHHCSLSKVQRHTQTHRDSNSLLLIVFVCCVQVLLAVGRKACTSDIGLECVRVQCSQDTGRIVVNERDQTSVDHIYAIGSVQHGRPSTTGLSVHAGKLLRTTVCDYTIVPTVVLTPLEYAACGLSEERANLTFGEDSIEVYHSYYWPLEWTLPARNKNSCYVKVICHIPDHERVVGLHVMGPNAGDILQGFVTAMKCGLTKHQLDATVGIHPGAAQVSILFFLH
uniref:Thioredoxin reductase 1, cytoplasmic n=1 Tax=Amphiprion percula TaxID=161767 RepID=A0A3P8UBB1_AMPPE